MVVGATVSEVSGTEELAVAPGPVDVVDGRVVDCGVVDFGTVGDFGAVVDVDERVVEVARGAVVVVARGRVVVVVRSVVGDGPVGAMKFDDTDAGRTSR